MVRLRMIWSILLAAVTLASTGAADETPEAAKLLWLGSSSIYYHNQPKVCAEWLSSHAEMPAESHLAGRSGTGVHVYLRPEFRPEYGVPRGTTVLDKIANGGYRYVVLQIPAEFIAGPEGEEHDRSLDVYTRAIRAAGAIPVFYEMGWGRDDTAARGRELIFRAAIRNEIEHFAPCSTAWATVRRQRPELELQNPPDRTHPGTLGVYLNLCCFYSAISERRPEALPRDVLIWRHLSDAEKAAAGARVASHPFDDYDDALPTWMKRLIVMAEREEVAPEVAEYLADVAWRECEAARRRLAEAESKGM